MYPLFDARIAPQTEPPTSLGEAGAFFMGEIMTKLLERSVLDGSKQPKTTTGEMKDALGNVRDYLFVWRRQ